MKVKPYISNTFKREAEEKMFQDIIYELQEYDSDKKVWVIGNIELVDTQLDTLVIKKNCLINIDMKNYKGEVKGSENGGWQIKKSDGRSINTEKNFFQQVKTQRCSLKDKMVNIIKNGKLSKFKDDACVFSNIKSWLCFNKGSVYDHDQITYKALNWFQAISVDRLGRKIENADSNSYKLNQTEIKEIIDSLSAEPYVLDKNNKILVEDIWSETEENPEDWETAKEANNRFKEILERTRDQDLKLICKHGIAMTSKSRDKSLQILKDLYESTDYDGYKDHDLRYDLLIESLRWYPDGEEGEEIEVLANELYEYMRKEDQTDKLYEIFTECTNESNDPKYGELHCKIGEFLLDRYPDDQDVLNGLLRHYAWNNKEKEFVKIARTLFENRIGVKDLFYLIIEGERYFYPIEDFKKILNYLEGKELSNSSKLEYLADFYELQLHEYWDDLSTVEKEILWNKAENCYIKMVKNSGEKLSSLYKIVRWYSLWEFEEKAEKYAEKIVDKHLDKLSSRQIGFLIDFFKKMSKKEGDFSYLDRTINQAIEDHLYDFEIMMKVGKIYEKRNQKYGAINCYENLLYNNEIIVYPN